MLKYIFKNRYVDTNKLRVHNENLAMSFDVF